MRILLYSGGMDSYLIKQLWKPKYSFYVNLASNYSQKEMEHLRQNREDIRLVRGIELSRFEREDFIIPYRNVYLILGVLNEYERLHPIEKMETDHEIVELCMGATAGDRVLDKSPEFAERLSGLLTYLSTPQHWTGGKSREIRVVLPFKNYTKRDLLREYIESSGMSKTEALEQAWYKSFSCYTPNKWGQPCGKCKPCFRKTIAFTLEGYKNTSAILDARDYIMETGIWDQIQQGTYGRAEEEKDIIQFMEETEEW